MSDPDDGLLPHRLLRRARVRPDDVAVSDAGDDLSFGQLERWVSKLSGELGAAGVGRETPVAVGIGRRGAQVATYLAVWRIGATVVVVDPNWPPGRTTKTLDLAKVKHIVTEGADHGLRRIDHLPARGGPEISRPVPTPGVACALVHQTSGSTGHPRLVGVTHRALAIRSRLYRDAYGIRPGDRSAWLAPPGASIGVIETWPFLSGGAAVHVGPELGRTSAVELQTWLLRNEITACLAPAPVAEKLLSLRWPADTALRHLTSGGEPVRSGPSSPLPFQLVLEYGSAEANGVFSTVAPGAPSAEHDPEPSLGVAWPEVRTLIEGGSGVEEAPAALSVATPQLARGYLGDPRSTADRFRPDPEVCGGRVFVTGDRVWRRAAGTYCHAGRIDNLVKVNGVLTDPAELERTILGHRSVEDVAVVAVERSAETALAAFIVAEPGASAEAVRRHVDAEAGSAFVPAHIRFVDELPVTDANKIDRVRLAGRIREEFPPPETCRSTDVRDHDMGTAEQLVVTLWSNTVGDTRRDVHFLDAGGSSRQALVLLDDIDEQVGVRVSLREFYAAPFLERLIEMVCRRSVAEAGVA